MKRALKKPELLVSASACERCLMGKTPLVSPERKADLIAGALKADSFFVCHVPAKRKADHDWKGSVNVCCSAFFARYKYDSLALRLASIFNWVRFIDVESSEKKDSSE